MTDWVFVASERQMKGSQSHGNNYLAQKTHLLVPGQVLELIPARLLFLPLSSVPSGTAARGTTVRVQTNKFPLHMSCLPMAWHADSCQQRGSASVASLVTLQHILSTCRPKERDCGACAGLGTGWRAAGPLPGASPASLERVNG